MTPPCSRSAPLIGKAFMLAVNPGKEEANLNRHSPIWPEPKDVPEEHGVQSESILYHSSTCQLVGHAEVGREARWAAIATTEVSRSCWNDTSEFTPYQEDGRPLTALLTEMFHLEWIVTSRLHPRNGE